MIVKNIQSDNFLKYENLSLASLPTHGLIAVSGQNESGKTSIGETLCFALFGRTFTLDLSDPRKLIRWGASRCSVSLTFTLGRETENNHETYRIERYLDNEGTYGAKLSRDEDDALLAKGPDEVNQRILDLISFGYSEFIESFYLAQRELTTPHPHSQTIKVMAGIAPLSNVRKEIASTVDDDYAQLDHSRVDFNDADQSYTDLSIDASWMPELQTSLEATEQQITSRKGLNDELQTNSKLYTDSLPVIQSRKRKKSTLILLSLILFSLAVAAWVTWVLLIQQADTTPAIKLSDWLQNRFSNWQHYTQWLLPAAIAATVLFIINWLLEASNRKKLHAAQTEAAHFTTSLESVNNYSNENTYTDRIAELIQQHNQDSSADETDEASISLDSIISKCKTFQSSEDEVSAITTTLYDRQSATIDKLSNHKLVHEFAVREEQKRLDIGREYADIMDDLESRIVEQSHLLEVKSTAVELLESAGHHLSHQFNQSILKLAGDALPSFTQGRYKHLKIDDSMDVRVFSSEKGDFLDLDEISSGTQRQVMLSLRLAMSQELINAIECAPQFIFLDEPFAFFDQERIRDTIAALPNFSKDIAQIWLVAQEYPKGVDADLMIECSRDTSALTIGS